jgi:DNA-binding GntR family transcriptional regulator
MTEKTAVLAAERAYRYTKDLIIRGELPGGQLVSEGKVCGELGVSRTPVHEAFLRLDAEKLLALSSRRGAVVLPMPPDEARNVLEMRQAIEAAAARRLVEHGTPSGPLVASLRSVLDRQLGHVGVGDVDAFVASDEEFHAGVVEASGNVIAVHFLAFLRDRQQRLRYQLLGIHPERLPGLYEDHVRLLGRLEAADGDGYCRELAAHVSRHQGAL